MKKETHHQEIQEFARRFAQESLAPQAEKIDREGELFPDIIAQLAQNGFLGIFIPEEYGGAAMDYRSYSLIVEELSRGCASSGVFVSAHNSLALWPILEFGTPEQKKKYLPRLATGEHVGCYCLSEPNAGSDAGSLTTYAQDCGDYYEISGVKNYITNGKEADIAVVFAKTQKTPDYRGISAFIVETQDPGFSIIKLEDKLGIRGSSTAQIALDKVKVPKENLLGPEQKGFRVAMATLDGGRIGIAAQALGIAQAALDHVSDYCQQRIQFGAPLTKLQAIQFGLADMSTKIAASRLLIWHASELKDAGKSYSQEAAQAKLFASEAAMWITTKAIQLAGGSGYIKEYPFERFFRDAKITEIYEGTSEIQRIVIAAQHLKKMAQS